MGKKTKVIVHFIQCYYLFIYLLFILSSQYDGMKIALISYVKFEVLIFCYGSEEMARIIHLTLLRLN